MANIVTKVQCTKCQHQFNIKLPVPTGMNIPVVAGKVNPAYEIMVYRITTNDVNRYIGDVVRSVEPDAQVLIYPRFSEKKQKKNSGGPRPAYVYLLIGMNEKVIDQRANANGFYGTLGWNRSVRVKSRLWFEFISRWLYDPEWIRKAMGSYNRMDEYEEKFGLTEAALKDISFYAAPRAVYPDGSKTPWVLTAIDPYLVIQDMLCEAGTKKVPGEIMITDVNQVSENMIEWTVHVSPFKNEAEINPHVMQILRGEEKVKRTF